MAILSDNDVIGYAAKIDDRVMATRQGRLIFFYDPEKLLKFIDDLSVKGHEVMLHGLGFDFLLERFFLILGIFYKYCLEINLAPKLKINTIYKTWLVICY